LNRLVGLARFLIRTEVRCRNLASKVLSLALTRLPDDWHARYGIQPLLVETMWWRRPPTSVPSGSGPWRKISSLRASMACIFSTTPATWRTPRTGASSTRPTSGP
ncbi:MAG: DUF4338 domain-containing protein, partial [Verrucomicrobia bacterium]|nr:DUF4338 domain-containing protein [Verrucomicrobiota bacterium]